LEYTSVSSSDCSDLTAALVLVPFVLFTCVVVLRPPRPLLFVFMALAGYWYLTFTTYHGGWQSYYAAFIRNAGSSFWVLIMTLYTMWTFGGTGTFPATEQPIEFILLYLLPFEVTLNMHLWDYIIPHVTLASSSASVTDGGILGTVLVIILGVILCSLILIQFYKFYRVGLLWRVLGHYVPFAIAFCILSALLSPEWLVHIHHYSVGIVIWPLTATPRGPNPRYSMASNMVLQGLCLGMSVNGLAMYSAQAPWDPGPPLPAPPGPPTPAPAPIGWRLEDMAWFATSSDQYSLSLRWNSSVHIPSETKKEQYALYMNGVELFDTWNAGSFDVDIPLATEGTQYTFHVYNRRTSSASQPLRIVMPDLRNLSNASSTTRRQAAHSQVLDQQKRSVTSELGAVASNIAGTEAVSTEIGSTVWHATKKGGLQTGDAVVQDVVLRMNPVASTDGRSRCT